MRTTSTSLASIYLDYSQLLRNVIQAVLTQIGGVKQTHFQEISLSSRITRSQTRKTGEDNIKAQS